VWVYFVTGPTGELLAEGIETHSMARKLAIESGYWPIEVWTEVAA
jgi:hypothetical protein